MHSSSCIDCTYDGPYKFRNIKNKHGKNVSDVGIV